MSQHRLVKSTLGDSMLEFNNHRAPTWTRLEFNTNLKEISSVSSSRQGSLPSQPTPYLHPGVNFRGSNRAQKPCSHGGSGLINWA